MTHEKILNFLLLMSTGYFVQNFQNHDENNIIFVLGLEEMGGSGKGEYVLFHVFEQISLYPFAKVSKIHDKQQHNFVPWSGGRGGDV